MVSSHDGQAREPRHVIWSRARRGFFCAGLALVAVVAVVIGQVAAAASSPLASKPDVTLRTFLSDIGAHKISQAKALMTPSYEKIIADAADSLFTNVITLTDITVGKVHYYGVRQANVPCTFVIDQHRVGGWNNGKVTFAFQLTESKPGSPWEIASGGTG
jgi:hypothetical protein